MYVQPLTRNEPRRAEAAGIYGGYGEYQERITGRVIRIFVLEPVPGT